MKKMKMIEESMGRKLISMYAVYLCYQSDGICFYM